MRMASLAVLVAASAVLSPASAPAQSRGMLGTPKKPATPAGPGVKGQGQLAGGNGQFGTVYSLKNGFNFAILGARYTMDPFVAYEQLTPKADQKLLVLDIAIKNARPEDAYLDFGPLLTIVDAQNQIVEGGSLGLASLRSKAPNLSLRPGQGLGQTALNDPLRVAFAVPAAARVVKVMVNQGRLGSAESVLRYYVAGVTKEEAGAAGDPKNVIAPLPDAVRDPSDRSGAVATAEGKAAVGGFVPSGVYMLRVDSVAISTDPALGELPEGKRYFVATITARSATDREASFFDVTGGDSPSWELTTADGERVGPAAYKKSATGEDADHTFKGGDEYAFRVVFTIGAEAAPKKLVIGAGNSRKWAIDVSTAK